MKNGDGGPGREGLQVQKYSGPQREDLAKGKDVLPRGAAWDESFHRQADARLWTGSAPSSAPSSLLSMRGRTDCCNLRLPVSCGVLHF